MLRKTLIVFAGAAALSCPPMAATALACMGFNPIGLRAAVEMCGVDRVLFGSDCGPIPYGIKEHVQIVEDVLPSPAERQQVFWKTSNRVFRLGPVDTDLVTPAFHQSR